MKSIGYSKMSQHAIAAMSYLATQYKDPDARASSAEIAAARELPQTLVAKILTILSQAGFVTGAPGPNGGYRIAKAPEAISFHQIVGHFESTGNPFPCPFGADYCPNENPCPIHDETVKIRESVERFLRETNFGCFEKPS
jgi:Rrf2 family transcriptional regulator, iron-sulfur cluster assembly transcription factor